MHLKNEVVPLHGERPLGRSGDKSSVMDLVLSTTLGLRIAHTHTPPCFCSRALLTHQLLVSTTPTPYRRGLLVPTLLPR